MILHINKFKKIQNMALRIQDHALLEITFAQIGPSTYTTRPDAVLFHVPLSLCFCQWIIILSY